jgi:osmotically-inducible protein OsmY
MASLDRVVRHVTSFVAAKADAVRHGTGEPKEGMDDATLARKVESVLFRDAESPKGEVDISAVDGIVELRGHVKRPEDVRWLEEQTRSVPEVRSVRNLLHQPKTPSPTRAASG